MYHPVFQLSDKVANQDTLQSLGMPTCLHFRVKMYKYG